MKNHLKKKEKGTRPAASSETAPLNEAPLQETIFSSATSSPAACGYTDFGIAGCKWAEQDLKLSEVRYRRLFETAKDGILILDADTGMIVDANPFLIEMLNSSHEIFVGKKVWELGFFKDIVANQDKFLELQKNGYVRYENLPLETDDGRRKEVEFVSNVYLEGDTNVIQCNIRDITERKKLERRQALSTEILGILNSSHALPDMISAVISAIKKETGFDAVAIRLKKGDDFPYFVQNGFSNDFLISENTIIARNKDDVVCKDANGKIMMGCTCGLVISGGTNTTNPLFTPGGSFWTNDSFPLLDLPADHDPRFRPHNKCIYDGYGSIALIPIRANQEIIGLLQLNKRKNNSLTLELVHFFERICASIGVVILQKQAEAALRESEDRYRLLFESSSDGIVIADTETKMFTHVNPAMCRMLGYTAKELTKMHLDDIHPEGALPSILAGFEATGMGKTLEIASLPCLRKDGRIVFAEINSNMVLLSGRKYNIAIFRDITERKLAEEEKAGLELQLRESQKMEAVGQLAGGISHDFNNLLSVINGYAQLLLADPALNISERPKIEEILRAGERAAGLTRQLLVFSRRHPSESKIIDLDAIISGMEKMLRRLIKENIIVTRNFSPGLWQIKADPGNIEQVIMNLVINASDAMPEGGILKIETGNLKIDDANRHIHPPDIKAGLYVTLAVSDNGCGMDENIRKHIFEPFFTTKDVGKGTGLGLATVYGIVKQSNARIDVQSEPGKGACFRIYFPQVLNEHVGVKEQTGTSGIYLGSETILLTEDEECIRSMLQEFLQSIGYTVLAACNGKEALTLAQNHKKEIHLLLTDVIMPGMNGFDLAKQLKSSLPEIKLLFMSGYINPSDIHGMTKARKDFIEKPLSLDALASKIHEILEN